MVLALAYNGQSSQELFSIDIQGFFQGFVLHKGGGGGEWGGAKNDNKSMVGHIPSLSFVLTFRNNLSNFNTWYFNKTLTVLICLQ